MGQRDEEAAASSRLEHIAAVAESERQDGRTSQVGTRSKKSVAIFLAVVLCGGGFLAYQMHSETRAEQRKAVAAAKQELVAAHSVADFARAMDRRSMRQGFGGEPDHGALGREDTAEALFMKACRECASADICERDRVSIVAGRSSENYNPCD